jgi:hypothetical protein
VRAPRTRPRPPGPPTAARGRPAQQLPRALVALIGASPGGRSAVSRERIRSIRRRAAAGLTSARAICTGTAKRTSTPASRRTNGSGERGTTAYSGRSSSARTTTAVRASITLKTAGPGAGRSVVQRGGHVDEDPAPRGRHRGRTGQLVGGEAEAQPRAGGADDAERGDPHRRDRSDEPLGQAEVGVGPRSRTGRPRHRVQRGDRARLGEPRAAVAVVGPLDVCGLPKWASTRRPGRRARGPGGR